MSDGAHLQGWKIKNEKPTTDAIGLYFGGNAEDVSLSADILLNIGFATVYLFNYRGYGLSEGKPSQKALYNDALEIHNYISTVEKVDLGKKLVLLGRSLGASVSVFVSAQRTVHRVILITPFNSLSSLLKEKFPHFPLNWFLKHPFPSDGFAKTNETSMLMILARNDTLIPNTNSLCLYHLWKGVKQLVFIEDAGHNDLHLSERYIEEIREFSGESVGTLEA
jgi:pimeloyl-ACP methyl ester carboxylesterase